MQDIDLTRTKLVHRKAVFAYNGVVISWHSMKVNALETSSNHYKIIALHEAGRVFG